MTLIGLTLLGLALAGFASDALDDTPGERNARTSETGAWDAMIFMLCLIGIVAAHRRKQSDDEEG